MGARRIGILLVLLAAPLPGCALLQRLLGAFHEPELAFDRVELKDLSLTGATANLHWRVRNDNPIELNLASLSYRFSVEGHPLLSGKPPLGLRIAAGGTTLLSFPAHVEFKDLAANLETFLTKDVARYQASGEVGIDTPVGVVALRLSKSGQFDVPKVPLVRPQAPRLDAISLTGARLTIPLEVVNRNRFSLPFEGLSGGILLSGAAVASPSVGAMSPLGPGETRVIPLEVSIDFLSAGMAAASAVRSRQVDLAYQGSIRAGGATLPVGFSQRMSLR